MTETNLTEEKVQAFKTLNALLQRRDRVVEKTGVDPLGDIGHIIKTAGKIQDTVDNEDIPNTRDIDPDEVFG